MIKIEYIDWCECLECHGIPVLCWAYLQQVGFWNSPSDHTTWSIRCHVGILVDFTFSSILHSLIYIYILRSSLKRAWCEVANLDRLRLFHQWECLNCNRQSRALSLVCEVALRSMLPLQQTHPNIDCFRAFICKSVKYFTNTSNLQNSWNFPSHTYIHSRK